ncbi:MAG: NAD(P)H-dependent oxidoreductase [Flavitalea sp.]
MATYVDTLSKNAVVEDQLKEEQYIIISGTNRADSKSYKVSQYYQHVLESKKISTSLVTLENLDLSNRSEQYVQMELEILIPAKKFIFICPEYNGSIPGVLKTLLDLSDYKKVWWGKKALLTGISSGRSGNVRGMEHLTTILHYLKVNVHPDKLPISSIDKLLNGVEIISDPDTISAINVQTDEFIKF